MQESPAAVRGTFIAIEASNDQLSRQCFEELSAKLQAQGYTVVEYRFTDEVRPQANQIATATLAAEPLLQAAGAINQALDNGQVVLAHGYSARLMMHSASHKSEQPAQKGHYLWLGNFLYDNLKLPTPDAHFLLSPPDDQTALDVAAVFQKDVTWLNVERNGRTMDVPTLVNHIWRSIQANLPLKPAAPAPTAKRPAFSVPAELSAELASLYQQTFEQILVIHQQLAEQFDAAADTVLPVACSAYADLITSHIAAGDFSSQLADLPAAQSLKPGRDLLNVWPRNELELLKYMVFEHSDLSINEIGAWLTSQLINTKLDLFNGYIKAGSQALNNASYTWEIVAETGVLLELVQFADTTTIQTLTPRHGYDIPAAIDQAGQSDQVEECFDLSLRLHSALVANGLNELAPLATLHGHINRMIIKLKAGSLQDLARSAEQQPLSQSARLLVAQLIDDQAQTHPILAGD